jgi:hypothetical protein
MNSHQRPTQVSVFSALLLTSAVFAVYLGTMASAYYVMSAGLFFTAYSLWNAWNPKAFKVLVIINQLSGLVLILAISWRRLAQPDEDLTLSISGVALIVNVFFGGPFLGILGVPLLGLLNFGTILPSWMASGAKQGAVS